MFFHTNLKFLYKKKGYTQEALANELNVKNTTVSTWVLGNSKPNVDTLLHLREILGVSLDNLFFKDFTDKIEFENTDKIELLEEDISIYENKKNVKSEKEQLPSDLEILKKAMELMQIEIWKLKHEIEEIKKNK